MKLESSYYNFLKEADDIEEVKVESQVEKQAEPAEQEYENIKTNEPKNTEEIDMKESVENAHEVQI